MSTAPTPDVMLEEGQLGNKPLPPPQPYNSHYKRRKSPCYRCICSCCIFLILAILILSLLTFYFFTVNNPRVPAYTIQNLQAVAFASQPNSSVQTNFLVTIQADNPNTNIGFIYGEDSSVDVVYEGTDICSGKLPHFHQGPMNVTMMKVDLVGKSEFGSGLQEAYKKKSEIPLLVKIKVPVRIVVGEHPLRELKVFVNCSLVVDNLAPNQKMNIVSSNMTLAFEF